MPNPKADSSDKKFNGRRGGQSKFHLEWGAGNVYDVKISIKSVSLLFIIERKTIVWWRKKIRTKKS